MANKNQLLVQEVNLEDEGKIEVVNLDDSGSGDEHSIDQLAGEKEMTRKGLLFSRRELMEEEGKSNVAGQNASEIDHERVRPSPNRKQKEIEVVTLDDSDCHEPSYEFIPFGAEVTSPKSKDQNLFDVEMDDQSFLGFQQSTPEKWSQEIGGSSINFDLEECNFLGFHLPRTKLTSESTVENLFSPEGAASEYNFAGFQISSPKESAAVV